MNNVIFTVEIKVKKEFSETIYPFMQAMHKLTHEFDEGCIQYDLFRDNEDKSKFYFVEEWEDEAALENHRQAEHYKNFIEFIDGKLESIDKVFEKIDTSSFEKFKGIEDIEVKI